MAAIERYYKIEQTASDITLQIDLQIEGPENLDLRIRSFFQEYSNFQEYFSKSDPAQSANFHLRAKEDLYFVQLQCIEKQIPLYKVSVTKCTQAQRLLSQVSSEEKFVQDIEKMPAIPPLARVRPLEAPLQGLVCRGIEFVYSREFQLQLSGKKKWFASYQPERSPQ